ncbi:2-succinyl-6-hydroxy-2,4-cyclohexadiene-1-carboxylate synthase [Halorubrum aidingense JCM 13560]|uniref:2-succinyl-6-hydroxy-2, 4-cyclohexadiene-1-carboxylate synthase n=1 Tax=Halorubrum aidingense JCM 13560 TaxID=1230454 RepID=M0PDA6_9EURY|nr:2-succinyl-6-hydroxy-2,4-cyclohexadiene-1-carboxylate synthase [Halorubrum aidingense JCM 13560]
MCIRDRLRLLANELSGADRGLIVAGPADPPGLDAEAITALSHATGFPVVADPLSGVRYGGHTRVAPVLGAYDAYLSGEVAGDGEAGGEVDGESGSALEWDDPDVVLRLGASPTSKNLRKYLAGTGADQYQVDPTGRWREAEFAATDLVVAEPSRLCARLSRLVAGGGGAPDWRAQWEDAERVARGIHRREADALADSSDPAPFHEGNALRAVADALPDPATLFVSNSMPVRDLDRFVGPTTTSVTALGNRGVSGIDGIVSSALGAGSATTDDLTLVVGDLALYHDTNGLLAIDRCGVDVTVVLINNDGGGIFHALPIESFEPEFTTSFKTPHGIEFEPMSDLHGLAYARIDARTDARPEETGGPGDEGRTPDAIAEDIEAAYARARDADGSHLIEVRTDAEASHRTRERLEAAVERAVHGAPE